MKYNLFWIYKQVNLSNVCRYAHRIEDCIYLLSGYAQSLFMILTFKQAFTILNSGLCTT